MESPVDAGYTLGIHIVDVQYIHTQTTAPSKNASITSVDTAARRFATIFTIVTLTRRIIFTISSGIPLTTSDVTKTLNGVLKRLNTATNRDRDALHFTDPRSDGTYATSAHRTAPTLTSIRDFIIASPKSPFPNSVEQGSGPIVPGLLAILGSGPFAEVLTLPLTRATTVLVLLISFRVLNYSGDLGHPPVTRTDVTTERTDGTTHRIS